MDLYLTWGLLILDEQLFIAFASALDEKQYGLYDQTYPNLPLLSRADGLMNQYTRDKCNWSVCQLRAAPADKEAAWRYGTGMKGNVPIASTRDP